MISTDDAPNQSELSVRWSPLSYQRTESSLCGVTPACRKWSNKPVIGFIQDRSIYKTRYDNLVAPQLFPGIRFQIFESDIFSDVSVKKTF